nr:hypothetical protein CFP56_52242 [Quercus suber]
MTNTPQLEPQGIRISPPAYNTSSTRDTPSARALCNTVLSVRRRFTVQHVPIAILPSFHRSPPHAHGSTSVDLDQVVGHLARPPTSFDSTLEPPTPRPHEMN